MRRGEVWWAHLPGSSGHRPVLLLSRDEAYAVRSLVTVAPITTRIRDIPVEVEFGPAERLPKRCVANLDSIVTIPKARLRRRIGPVSIEKMQAVEDAVRFALGMEG